jgi:hypothetical protein
VTWLSHLVGDLHQPLHATAYFTAKFLTGHRGGNLANLRISGGGIVKLHQFWDGLLGSGVTRGSILSMVEKVEGVAKDDAGAAADLKAH